MAKGLKRAILTDLTQIGEQEKTLKTLRKRLGAKKAAWTKAGMTLDWGAYQAPISKSVAELKKEYENAKEAYERALGHEIETLKNWEKNPLASVSGVRDWMARPDVSIADIQFAKKMIAEGWEDVDLWALDTYRYVFKILKKNTGADKKSLASDDIVDLLQDMQHAGIDLRSTKFSATTLTKLAAEWQEVKASKGLQLATAFATQSEQKLGVAAFRKALKNI